MMARSAVADMRRRAGTQDEGAIFILLVTSVAAIATRVETRRRGRARNALTAVIMASRAPARRRYRVGVTAAVAAFGAVTAPCSGSTTASVMARATCSAMQR